MKGSAFPHELDLGAPGHSLRFFVNQDDDVVGCVETHPSKIDTRGTPGALGVDQGEPCSGSLAFRVPEAGPLTRLSWEVLSWTPLTLSPSVLCTLCGNHGFIRDGRWEAAR